MQKKNKLMLAAAIGMVAVVVATTAVRCSIARTADEAGGAASVASDGFLLADRYVEGPAAEGGVEVTGLAEPYLELIGGDGDGLARAIGEWARANAPSAGEASFDGEVFLDTGSGRVSATFHLDDAASTIVAVSYEAGAFDVAG